MIQSVTVELTVTPATLVSVFNDAVATKVCADFRASGPLANVTFGVYNDAVILFLTKWKSEPNVSEQRAPGQ